MIEMYKIVHNVDKVDKINMFSPSQSSRTRDYLWRWILEPSLDKKKKNTDLLIKL